MKKLLLIISIAIATNGIAQKKQNGYGFIGAGMHFIGESANIAGRFNLGVLPSRNVGFGIDAQYIRDFGVPVLADLRFISNHKKGTRLTMAFKAGQNFYQKPSVAGGFTYGAEGGIIFGKSNNGFYISAQYLSIAYATKGTSFTQQDFGFSFGAKF